MWLPVMTSILYGLMSHEQRLRQCCECELDEASTITSRVSHERKRRGTSLVLKYSSVGPRRPVAQLQLSALPSNVNVTGIWAPGPGLARPCTPVHSVYTPTGAHNTQTNLIISTHRENPFRWTILRTHLGVYQSFKIEDRYSKWFQYNGRKNYIY